MPVNNEKTIFMKWDSHDFIERAHGNLIRQVDQPIAALIKDLKQRGLLDDTLIVWCGEFGRIGRADHLPRAQDLPGCPVR